MCGKMNKRVQFILVSCLFWFTQLVIASDWLTALINKASAPCFTLKSPGFFINYNYESSRDGRLVATTSFHMDQSKHTEIQVPN